MAAVTTVNDLLDGHVSLDVECLDRIYLNGYVPNLQTYVLIIPEPLKCMAPARSSTFIRPPVRI